jgi:DNA (cytosine-5)-methyltransferase 1
MGYHQALPGIEIVGVDHKPQRHYPFSFVQSDALNYPLDGFDIVHASPPCQAHSCAGGTHDDEWGHLFATLQRLREWGGVYVVENVMAAQITEDFRVCGSALGLVDEPTKLYLQRHRKFWASGDNWAGPLCKCAAYKRSGYYCGGVYGGSSPSHLAPGVRREGDIFKGYRPGADVARRLMGIDWMNRRELSQAIPPAYTQWIATQLVDRGHIQLP